MRQIHKKMEPVRFTNWKNKVATLTGRIATYEDLKDYEYFMLKKSLVEEQGFICCYCERRIGANKKLTDCDIEHFMPRNPDSSMPVAQQAICRAAQLDYFNMFASCEGELADSIDHCNHKKDNWFDFSECISPLETEIRGLYGFKLNGEVYALGDRGREMLKHLNLNSYVLQEQRKEAYYAVLELEFEDEDLLDDEEYVEATIAHYDNMNDGKYEQFCSMITYCMKNYL
ncbi:MAG: retron system putative HNH endonuclease [Lachnospiraceae bacterium]|nr:retron system putative HNH endonuclease [Lachnospiraceae bacterium]